LKAPDKRDAELNELLWWSNWAKLSWKGDGYLLSSEVFKESFFNRAGSLTCRSLPGTAPWAELGFSRRGLDTTLLAFDSCKCVSTLLRDGYRRVDAMTVLLSKARIVDARPHPVGASKDPGSWTSAYLRSFYGDVGLTDAVEPIVSSLSKSKYVTFLESRIAGAVAGVSALFRTPGLVGVYCVGTVPEHRNQGVATSLLADARRIADSEERNLILQSLKSDRALSFYTDRGFEKLHTKLVLKKSSNGR
jgi:ribosomal protein S18 acetylase RimI-like enzyme